MIFKVINGYETYSYKNLPLINIPEIEEHIKSRIFILKQADPTEENCYFKTVV